MLLDTDRFELRLAQSRDELIAAQRLRYRVFVQEFGAVIPHHDRALGIERDAYDPYFEHMILIDHAARDPFRNVIATYRLAELSKLSQGPGCYSETEFDITALKREGKGAIEFGRSCVDPRYRGSAALSLIWEGLAKYVTDRDCKLLFGTASFPTTDPIRFAQSLSHLFHQFSLGPDLPIPARPEGRAPMDLLARDQIDRRRAMAEMPPLLKSYLRLGARVGTQAFVDHQFKTLDVFLLLDVDKIPAKYRKRYMPLEK